MREVALVLAVGLAGFATAQTARDEQLPYKFGTTVVAAIGFKGQIYFVKEGAQKLPNFSRLKPVGTVYTPYLNIPAQDFREGFPGVTNRFEWFAIDYTGRFWVSEPGAYRFALASDDGSILYADGKRLINNDRLHSIEEREGSVNLGIGVHQLRVSYYQGPGDGVALILRVMGPKDDAYRIFNFEEFKPPANAAGWSAEGKSRGRR